MLEDGFPGRRIGSDLGDSGGAGQVVTVTLSGRSVVLAFASLRLLSRFCSLVSTGLDPREGDASEVLASIQLSSDDLAEVLSSSGILPDDLLSVTEWVDTVMPPTALHGG